MTQEDLKALKVRAALWASRENTTNGAGEDVPSKFRLLLKVQGHPSRGKAPGQAPLRKVPVQREEGSLHLLAGVGKARSPSGGHSQEVPHPSECDSLPAVVPGSPRFRRPGQAHTVY